MHFFDRNDYLDTILQVQFVNTETPHLRKKSSEKKTWVLANADMVIDNKLCMKWDKIALKESFFLKVLLEHSGERRVVISCFDSEACIMLKKKQNKFPVLFLTQGQSQKYPPYKDFRWAKSISCTKTSGGLKVSHV